MNASTSPQLASSPLALTPSETTTVCVPLVRPVALHRTADMVGSEPTRVRSTN